MRHFRLACGILLLALAVSHLHAGGRRWTLDGPYAASLRSIAFDPVDSSIVLAGSGNGVFRSSDGGRTWSWTNLRWPVYDLAVTPDGQKAWAASLDGLYTSSDRGTTWSAVNQSSSYAVVTSGDGRVVYADSDDGILRSTDGGATFSDGTEIAGNIDVDAIVIDPLNSDKVWVLDLFEGVFRSTDGGAQWQRASEGLDAEFYSSLIVDPSTGALYAGSSDGLFKSTDGASSWSLLAGTSFSWYRSLDIAAGPPSLLIAGTGDGVQLSSDGGASWTEPKLYSARAVAIDPRNSANILACSNSNLFLSTDGGASYSLAGSGMTAFETESISADPDNASTVYTAGEAGIFRSTDRGKNWSPLGATADHPNGPSTFQILVDPTKSTTLYASTYDGELLRSENSGVSWTDIARGLPGDVELMALDPLTSGVIYVYSIDGVYKKTGGSAWVKSNGLPEDLYPIFITVDPQDSSTVYIGGQEHLLRSENGGQSWSSAATGIGPDEFLSGLAVDPFDRNHLVAWADNTYESTDRGVTWKVFEGVEPGNSVVFDPTTRGLFYQCGYDSVRVTRDGGLTWAALGGDDVLIDPRLLVVAADGKTLYAGTFDSGVWVWEYRTTRRRAVR